METRKQKIIEILAKYWIRRGWIESDESMVEARPLTAKEELADAIMALPIHVPSDVDIEDMADKKHPCYNDHVDSNAIDCNIGFIEGAKWAINEILKRNGKVL